MEKHDEHNRNGAQPLDVGAATLRASMRAEGFGSN
jgi:hypothetical protein